MICGHKQNPRLRWCDSIDGIEQAAERHTI